MKKLLFVMGTAIISATLSLSVSAAMPENVQPVAPVAAAGTAGANHPCHAIEEACKAAGFVRGQAAEGKGLRKDCMKPIIEGQAVAGVTVSAEDVQACKAKIAERSERK